MAAQHPIASSKVPNVTLQGQFAAATTMARRRPQNQQHGHPQAHTVAPSSAPLSSSTAWTSEPRSHHIQNHRIVRGARTSPNEQQQQQFHHPTHRLPQRSHPEQQRRHRTATSHSSALPTGDRHHQLTRDQQQSRANVSVRRTTTTAKANRTSNRNRGVSSTAVSTTHQHQANLFERRQWLTENSRLRREGANLWKDLMRRVWPSFHSGQFDCALLIILKTLEHSSHYIRCLQLTVTATGTRNMQQFRSLQEMVCGSLDESSSYILKALVRVLFNCRLEILRRSAPRSKETFATKFPVAARPYDRPSKTCECFLSVFNHSCVTWCGVWLFNQEELK